VSLFPVVAPFILVGLGIWWLVRRSKLKAAAVATGAATAEAATAEGETIRL